MKIDIEEIEKRHKIIISKGIKLNKQVKKDGYGYQRTLDIIDNMQDIIEGLPEDTKIDIDACIIAGYWLDVGKGANVENPEKISANMLSDALAKKIMIKNSSKHVMKQLYTIGGIWYQIL